MVLYFFIYSICFITMFFDRKNVSIKTKKQIMTFVIIILTLFFGLRWECGTDWEQYYNYFTGVEWNNFYNYNRYGDETLEIGFSFINLILKTISFETYTFYLIITNLARFLLIAFVSFKLSKFPIISFFGFLSLQYMFPTRHPFATAIYMVGFIFILNRDLRKYIYTWLLACSIHISSILVAPLYFLYGIRLKFIWQILFYIGTVVLANLLNEYLQAIGLLLSFGSGIIDEKIATYTQAFREIDQTRGLISIMLPLFFLCIFEYTRRKTKFSTKGAKDFNFMIICYLLATGIWNIFSNSMPDLCRYVEFINTWPLLIPIFINRYYKYFYIIVLFLFAYYLYRMNNTINLGEYHDLFIPYHSVFS